MTEQLWWMVGIVSVILAAAVGFLLGRRGHGERQRLAELEAEVERQKDEIAGYKRDVQAHFDTTATLFTSMAGSYRELFDHLSAGYEKLSGGSARELFRQRVDAALLEGAGAVPEPPLDDGTAGGDEALEPSADGPHPDPERSAETAGQGADSSTEEVPPAPEGEAGQSGRQDSADEAAATADAPRRPAA